MQLENISSYLEQILLKGNALSNSLDPRYGQKHLTISSFDLSLKSNNCKNLPTLSARRYKVTNKIHLNQCLPN